MGWIVKHPGLYMRTFSALVAFMVAATVAGCGSVATAEQPARSAGNQANVSTGSGLSSVVTVSCADRTSDTASLQKAIDSSAAGSLIEIKGPVCLLRGGITFLGDRTYAGYDNTGTVLKQDGAMKYLLASQSYADNTQWTGDPLTIRDLTVECNGSGATDGIIVLNWQVDVEDVDVNDCGGSGVVDTNTTANGHAVKNTSVNSRFDDNFISNSGKYGFEVLDTGNSVTDGFLDDNLIAYSGLDAIHLQNAAGWDISGNHLYSDSQNAIYADRLYGTTISDNYIEDFGATQRSGTWYAIVATVQGGNGSTIFNNKISNNMGESGGARYVYVCISGTNYGTGFLSVTGNVIVGDRPSDVGFSLSGGANKLVVASSGNEVANVGTVRSDASSVTETAGT
jgi:Right handed beta helix region